MRQFADEYENFAFLQLITAEMQIAKKVEIVPLITAQFGQLITAQIQKSHGRSDLQNQQKSTGAIQGTIARCRYFN